MELVRCRELLASSLGDALREEERDRWERMLADWSKRPNYPGYSNMYKRLEGCIEQSLKTREFATQVAAWLIQEPSSMPVRPQLEDLVEVGAKPIEPNPWRKLSTKVQRGWEEVNCETGKVVTLFSQMELVSHSCSESEDDYRPALSYDRMEMVTSVIGERGPIEVPEELERDYSLLYDSYLDELSKWNSSVANRDRIMAENLRKSSEWQTAMDDWKKNPVNLVHLLGLRVEDGQIVGKDYEGYERVLSVWSIDQL